MNSAATGITILIIIIVFAIFIAIIADRDNEDENKDEEAENTNNNNTSSEQQGESAKPQVKYCPACGAQNNIENNFCVSCGKKLIKEPVQQEASQNNQTINVNTGSKRDLIVCPKCGSTNIHFVTTQASQNFDAKDACCGYALCGTPGLLCGVKHKTESKTVRKCMSCNHEF